MRDKAARRLQDRNTKHIAIRQDLANAQAADQEFARSEGLTTWVSPHTAALKRAVAAFRYR